MKIGDKAFNRFSGRGYKIVKIDGNEVTLSDGRIMFLNKLANWRIEDAKPSKPRTTTFKKKVEKEAVKTIPQDSYKCVYCGKLYKSKKYYKKHLKTHES